MLNYVRKSLAVKQYSQNSNTGRMIRKHIPNFITSLNVLCGSVAVVFIMKGVLTTAVLPVSYTHLTLPTNREV